MYKKDNGQLSIMEFISPFGKLDPKNRWVQIANMIPWKKYEQKYAEKFCEDNGAPAIKFRMAMGTLIIKQRTNHSDEEILQDILENPYMQYLIGLHEFTTTAPFASTSITNFRKYISKEMINEINDEMFRNGNDKDDGNGDTGSDDNTKETATMKKASENQQQAKQADSDNEGTLMLDATCAPADIAYPTDVNLLNEAREKLEGMIDALHPQGHNITKPRTYRKKARRNYLHFIKQKQPGHEKVRKAIGQQLRYVKRNIQHIDNMLQKYSIDRLSSTQQKWLETIRLLYQQQLSMYEQNTHSVDNRIVSISQPHVRPIVRGKARAPVEFGAKVSISLVKGYTFIDRQDWEAYNEATDLIPAVEAYKKHYGHYPERVLADHIYRNRDNRAYCKKLGIRLSGPRLGKPPKEKDKDLLKQSRTDACDRSAVEGKFGEGKTKYGLDRIMARLKDSSETVIALSFFCMNISRRLRILLHFFSIRSFFRFHHFFIKFSWVFG